MIANTIGAIGVWFSVLLCASSACTFVKERPRYFTVLALLALSLAILIPYYSNITGCESSSHFRRYTMAQHELLSSLRSFLYVYIGGILSQEASDVRRQSPNISRVSSIQVRAFWLLIFTIVVTFPPLNELLYGIGTGVVEGKEFEVFVVFGFIGWWSLLYGLFDLFGRSIYNIMVLLVLVVYFCCSTVYRYREINDENMTCMTWRWAVAFAALKIIVTFLLAYRLSKETMNDDERRRPVRTFVFRQFPDWLRP